MFEQQSMESDQEKRKRLVWEIDRRLQEDQARPMVYHLRFATCWQRKVKGLRMIVNSVFNGWRFEDVWLDEKSVPRALYAACTIGPTRGNLPRIIALHQSPTKGRQGIVKKTACWIGGVGRRLRA